MLGDLLARVARGLPRHDEPLIGRELLHDLREQDLLLDLPGVPTDASSVPSTASLCSGDNDPSVTRLAASTEPCGDGVTERTSTRSVDVVDGTRPTLALRDASRGLVDDLRADQVVPERRVLCWKCGSNRVRAISMRGATGSPRPSTSLGLGTSSMTPPEHDHRTRDARVWGHDASPPSSPAGRYGAVSFGPTWRLYRQGTPDARCVTWNRSHGALCQGSVPAGAQPRCCVAHIFAAVPGPVNVHE